VLDARLLLLLLLLLLLVLLHPMQCTVCAWLTFSHLLDGIQDEGLIAGPKLVLLPVQHKAAAAAAAAAHALSASQMTDHTAVDSFKQLSRSLTLGLPEIAGHRKPPALSCLVGIASSSMAVYAQEAACWAPRSAPIAAHALRWLLDIS
jgi:hypothetical protein